MDLGGSERSLGIGHLCFLAWPLAHVAQEQFVLSAGVNFLTCSGLAI